MNNTTAKTQTFQDKHITKRIKGFVPYILVFLACLLPRIYTSFASIPLLYTSDEVSGISIAAKLAGYNWNDVVSHAGYYGFGYLWIFFPLFRFIDSPVLIYRLIQFARSATGALVAPICYAFLSKNGFKTQKKLLFFASVLCGYIQTLSTLSGGNNNEEILALITVICCYVLTGILKTHSKKIKKTLEVLLLAILFYSITIHSRAVVLLVAIIIVSALCFLIWKKIPLDSWVYIFIIGGYFVIKQLLKLYQAGIWSGKSRNIDVTSGIYSIFEIGIDSHTISSIGRVIAGQLYTGAVVTGGLLLFLLAIAIIYCLQFKRFCSSSTIDPSFVTCCVFTMCILMTILAMSLTWLKGVYNGNPSELRAFTYTRYYGIFVSPLFMCGMVIAKNNWKLIKLTVLASLMLLILLSFCWFFQVWPNMANREIPSIFYMTLGGMKRGEAVTSTNWIIASGLFSIIMVIGSLCLCKKNALVYFLIVIMLLISERLYVFNYSILPVEKNTYYSANAGSALISEIETFIDIQNIYVYDASTKTDHQIFYEYQFLNYRKHIIPQLPSETETNSIIFSNKDIRDLTSDDYSFACLDDNEYVFCRGKQYVDIINALGYNLTPVS